jgi:glutaredoxin 3
MTNVTKEVIIYSTPSCHFCHMAKDFFNENNIAFTDYDVAADPEKRKELIEKSGQMGVPVILIGGDMVIGFNKPKIIELLGL